MTRTLQQDAPYPKVASVQDLAAWVSKQFENRTRDNGDEFKCLRDGAPAWIRDRIIMPAHDSGKMLPDDWRYEFIVESLGKVQETNSNDLDCPQFEDEVYTHTILSWLSSRNDRTCYVDDAAKDYGHGETVDHDIQNGMRREKEEVYHSVLEALTEIMDEIETE